MICCENVMDIAFRRKKNIPQNLEKTITITSHLYSLNLGPTIYPHWNTPQNLNTLRFKWNSNKNSFNNLELTNIYILLFF